jgi:hypothetical protein
MYERQNFLSAAAVIYAALSMLAGIGMLAFAALMLSAFGVRSTDWRFVVVFLVPAALFIGLARSIRRQKVWAMIVVLVIGAALRAMLGFDTSLIGWVTLFGVILFAVLTGMHLVWGGALRR